MFSLYTYNSDARTDSTAALTGIRIIPSVANADGDTTGIFSVHVLLRRAQRLKKLSNEHADCSVTLDNCVPRAEEIRNLKKKKKTVYKRLHF